MKLCNAAGCSKPVLYGELCKNHTEKRHKQGHSDLQPLNRREVRQYHQIISTEMTRTRVTESVHEFFDKMTEEQTAIVADMNMTGRGHLNAYYAALDFVDSVGDKGKQVLFDLMGYGWMLYLQPDRFPNPESISLTAAKVLRWSLVKGAKRSVRKTGLIDVSKRALGRGAKKHLGDLLVPTLVSFGFAMCKTYVEHEKAKGDLKRDIMAKITAPIAD